MTTPPAKTSAAGAVVIDANICVAIATKEADREPQAHAELQAFAARGFACYAPGVIIAETLYVLCRKRHDGSLSAPDYAQALVDFELLLSRVLPPPNGDVSLTRRAFEIASGYGCSRSADGLYIALAEVLSAAVPTVLLTLDSDLPNQAAANAPSVTVRVLTA